MRARIAFCAVVLVATLMFAKGRPNSGNLPVTTIFEGVDGSGAVADIQSDGLGSYSDGVDAVTSFLTSNGYNGIAWGDWQFGTLNSSTRLVGLSFAKPIAVAEGGTATPNPPFAFKDVTAHIEDKCTQISNSMLQMSGGQIFPCPMIVYFLDSDGSEYRVYMAPNWTQPATPETTFVQVTCNAVAADGCNDWYIDPVPAGTDGAGNPIPGEAVGRLVYFAPRGGKKNTADSNRGDYRFRFHFHITRP